MTGLLQQEEYNPGDEQRAGTLTTQQCMEQLGRSLLRETCGPTVSPKQEMPQSEPEGLVPRLSADCQTRLSELPVVNGYRL